MGFQDSNKCHSLEKYSSNPIAQSTLIHVQYVVLRACSGRCFRLRHPRACISLTRNKDHRNSNFVKDLLGRVVLAPTGLKNGQPHHNVQTAKFSHQPPLQQTSPSLHQLPHFRKHRHGHKHNRRFLLRKPYSLLRRNNTNSTPPRRRFHPAARPPPQISPTPLPHLPHCRPLPRA